jgi:hypothetical protein
MFENKYRPTSILQIVFGIAAFVVVLGLFCSLPNVVKRVGDFLLYLPSKLGMVQRVKPEEVRVIDLRSGSTTLQEFSVRGAYAVYTSDYDLLTTADLQFANHRPPWIKVAAQASGEELPVSFVTRGLAPYDTPLADGRPVFTFVVVDPGTYVITHPTPYAFIAIVPDYTSGNEGLIIFVYVIEIALVLIVVSGVYRRRYQHQREQIQSIKETHAQRGAQMESFMEKSKKKKR